LLKIVYREAMLKYAAWHRQSCVPLLRCKEQLKQMIKAGNFLEKVHLLCQDKGIALH